MGSDGRAVGGEDGFSTWRRELRESVTAGAALAALVLVPGCLEQADNTNVEATAGQGGGGDPGDESGATVPANSLAPYSADRVTCVPTPDGPPYRGSECCFEALCYVPANGENCPTIRHENGAVSYRVSPQASGELYSGPGACACSVDGRLESEGPHAPNLAVAAVADGDPAATCCYVVGSQYCLGRPFIWNNLGHLAPLTSRADWSLFS